MRVGILMGSPNDSDKMSGAVKALEEFGISSDVRVLSAHRTPALVHKFVESAPSKGIKLFICGAGMAAHLAGAVAGLTTLPVIGVPLSGSALNGQDALYATVQMPKGIPVATVAIDGAYNAGMLAIQMLAIADRELAEKLITYRKEMAEKIADLNK